MKIFIIAQYGKTGGTREFLKKILSVHQSEGFQTHVMLYPSEKDSEIREFVSEKGATYSEFKRRQGFYKSIFGSVFFEYSNYASILKEWDPDIVVASVSTSYQVLFPFMQKYPLLYILHTIPKEMNYKLKSFYKMFSIISKRNHFVCGVSNATVDSVVKNWGYNRDKLTVLHNSYDPDNICKPTDYFEKGDPIVLTLGHLQLYKNPEGWLEVAKQVIRKHNSVRFIWLGSGPLISEFQKKTKSDERIDVLGYREDVKMYYSKASIYFQPSEKENHSLSVLDGMANGLPCVVSNVGGQSESVQEGVNGFVCDYDNIEAFSERILTLLNNPELRLRMGQKSRIIADKKFHPDTYKTNLMSLYNKVLDVS